MKKYIPGVLVLVFTLTALLACDRREDTQPVLRIMTHDSFDVSAEVIAAFEKENDVKVMFLKTGDAGAALNQAILSAKNPMADIFFGVDNTFMGRALDADIFEAYSSPMLEKIPDSLELDKSKRLLPVDFGDICLNYDKSWFRSKKLDPPGSFEDLTRPGYKGLTVVENPATSSPGLAFLLATVAHFGEDGYVDFWKALKANDVMVTSGWEDAYWGQFSASGRGKRPLVVSYASSPPVEVFYSDTPLDEAPTDVVLASTFRQVEFVGILKKTKNRKLAEKMVDFMLDKRFQEDIPLKMFVFPANENAELPGVFKKHAKLATDPVMLAPEAISSGRDRWIQTWTGIMMH